MTHASVLSEWLPAGSDWRISLAGLPSHKKTELAALVEYVKQLRHCSEQYREPAVAKAKLNWWQIEIQKSSTEASHPISQVLAKTHLAKLPLLALIEASELSLDTHYFATQAELNQHYQHTGGIFIELMARLLQDNQPLETPLQKACHQAGIALEIVRHLMYLPTYLARQHLYFPITEIETLTIDLNEFMQLGSRHPKFQALIQNQLTLAQAQLSEAKTELAKYVDLKPLRIFIALQLAQLAATEQRGLKVCEHRIEISQLKKAWLAFWIR